VGNNALNSWKLFIVLMVFISRASLVARGWRTYPLDDVAAEVLVRVQLLGAVVVHHHGEDARVAVEEELALLAVPRGVRRPHHSQQRQPRARDPLLATYKRNYRNSAKRLSSILFEYGYVIFHLITRYHCPMV